MLPIHLHFFNICGTITNLNMSQLAISSALISVYHKTGLESIIKKLDELDVRIYSTGGTQKYIEELGVKVNTVEDLTSYPSILDGRVKTLHPKIFGGILAKRENGHLEQLQKYDIPELDLVVVDLYPFEETVRNTTNEQAIIEKIDIGGISLIRAAAKNYNDIVVIPSKAEYEDLERIIDAQAGITTLADRKRLASKAFAISSKYDSAIFSYFTKDVNRVENIRITGDNGRVLRYGENPHQKAIFFGDLSEKFEHLGGKKLSYNNLVDIDAAVEIIEEFKDSKPTFAILKHTNPCGIASRNTASEAWDAALAGDPVSAFGGILITNTEVDLETAEKINKLFYEVLIATSFSDEALAVLLKKSKRVILSMKEWGVPKERVKTILNGTIWQQNDLLRTHEYIPVTEKAPNEYDIANLKFANKCVKHIKSNTIVFVKDEQLLGMGCGQTSRIDACKQAIEKADRMGFSLKGAYMASDAFFPFPDCVELANEAGVEAIVQPGGSIKDQLSIDKCNEFGIKMVFTGKRHFRH